MKGLLNSLDGFKQKPADHLKFNGLEKHESMFGGFCSLLIMIVTLGALIYFAIPIFKVEKPYNSSIETGLE